MANATASSMTRRRWFRITPGWLIVGLLLAEAALAVPEGQGSDVGNAW